MDALRDTPEPDPPTLAEALTRLEAVEEFARELQTVVLLQAETIRLAVARTPERAS